MKKNKSRGTEKKELVSGVEFDWNENKRKCSWLLSGRWLVVI